MQRNPDPSHPIIERPWEYEITRLAWNPATNHEEAYLDVTFQKGKTTRRLRFLNPSGVHISLAGTTHVQCGEMAISDVSGRGLEGKGVRVAEFGASGSPLQLWAREVIDLDQKSAG